MPVIDPSAVLSRIREGCDLCRDRGSAACETCGKRFCSPCGLAGEGHENCVGVLKDVAPGDSLPMFVRTPVGIENLGTTCYAASALQLIANTAYLRYYFNSGMEIFQSHVQSKCFLSTFGASARLLQRFLSEYDLTDKNYLPVSDFFRVYGQDINPWFGDIRVQHDGQEFLSDCIDKLHEDLNVIKLDGDRKLPVKIDGQKKGEPEVECYKRQMALHRVRDNSVLHEIYGGIYRSKLTCGSCGQTSANFEKFCVVPCPLPVQVARTIRCVVHRLPRGSLPITILLDLPMGSRHETVRHVVGERFKIDPDKLIAVVPSHENPASVRNPETEVASIYSVLRNDRTEPLFFRAARWRGIGDTEVLPSDLHVYEDSLPYFSPFNNHCRIDRTTLQWQLDEEVADGLEIPLPVLVVDLVGFRQAVYCSYPFVLRIPTFAKWADLRAIVMDALQRCVLSWAFVGDKAASRGNPGPVHAIFNDFGVTTPVVGHWFQTWYSRRITANQRNEHQLLILKRWRALDLKGIVLPSGGKTLSTEEANVAISDASHQSLTEFVAARRPPRNSADAPVWELEAKLLTYLGITSGYDDRPTGSELVLGSLDTGNFWYKGYHVADLQRREGNPIDAEIVISGKYISAFEEEACGEEENNWENKPPAGVLSFLDSLLKQNVDLLENTASLTSGATSVNSLATLAFMRLTVADILDSYDFAAAHNADPTRPVLCGGLGLAAQSHLDACEAMGKELEPVTLPLPTPSRHALFSPSQWIITDDKMGDNSRDIIELLREEFEATEIIASYECESCNTKSPAKKKHELYRCGDYVFIALKRFTHMAESDTFLKNSLPIRFPADGLVDLREFLEAGEESMYQIYGAVIHSGTMHSGHYVSLIRDYSGEGWFLIDDEEVRKCPNPEVRFEHVYIIGLHKRSLNIRAISRPSKLMPPLEKSEEAKTEGEEDDPNFEP